MYSSIVMLAVSLFASWSEGPFRSLTLDQALVVAHNERKVVLVHFFKADSIHCKRLDMTTWEDAGVCAWLAEKTVALRLDADRESELVGRFRISAYPTMLYLNSDGAVIGRVVGYRNPSEFLRQGMDTLEGRGAVSRAKSDLSEHADAMTRKRNARALMRAGRNEEALSEFLWCFDHGRDSNGFGGVRLSFLLADIVDLGRRYPAAFKALEDRRNGMEAKLLLGTGSSREAMDLASLNDHLGTPERSLDLYDKLKKDDLLGPSVSTVLLSEIRSHLIKARRYGDFLAAIGDPVAECEEAIRTFKLAHHVEGKDGKRPDPVMEIGGRSVLRQLISGWCDSYESLLGTKRFDDGARIAERLIACEGSGFMYAELIRRAIRAEAYGEAKNLGEKGLSTLPLDRDRRMIMPAIESIPKTN